MEEFRSEAIDASHAEKTTGLLYVIDQRPWYFAWTC